MTYEYSDINQHDARYNLARDYPGGIEMLAKRFPMSVNVLRNKLAPGIKTHHITEEEDSLIIEYCVEARVENPFRALIAKNYRHGLIAFPMPDITSASNEDLTKVVCRAIKEFSDLAAEASKAIADNKITQDELERIEKEAREALGAIAELRHRMREEAQRG